MEIRDKLLMHIDEMVQAIYEVTDKDYDELTQDYKNIVDALRIAESTVMREL